MTEVPLPPHAPDAVESERLRALDALSTTMGEQILTGARLTELLATLARTVHRPVVFDDFSQQLVASATVPGIDEGEVISWWEEHRRHSHGAKDAEVADVCRWHAVRLHDEDWGILHVLTDDADEFTGLALERAVTFITLWLWNRRETTALIDGARSELIADLWGGRRWSRDTVLQRSRSVGGDLDRPVLQAVAIRMHGQELADAALRRALRAALERLRSDARRHRVGCMAGVVESTCVGILGLSEEQSDTGLASRVAADTLGALDGRFDEPIVAVGMSRGGTVGHLRKLITEAVDAARHGAEVTMTSGVYLGAELGLLRLLGTLADGPELLRYVDDELGSLLALDPATRDSLLPTLRAYLDAGGNKTTTAKTLHIERRTLYYRLQRLERVLEEDLDSTAVQLRLQVAAQGLDVLRSRGRIVGERIQPLPSNQPR